MKKLQFFLLAAVAIVFAACSNDDVVLTDTGSNSSWNGGNAYIGVTVSMPTVTSTRAANDKFEYGLSDEYAVNDAYLLLFYVSKNDITATTTEDDAVFHSVYKLGEDESWGPNITGNDNDPTYRDNTYNTTSTHTYVQTIDTDGMDINNGAIEGKLYALAVLNGSNILHLTGQGVDGVVRLGDLELTNTDRHTFGNLKKALYEAADGATQLTTSAGGFFMTNAPLATESGGTVDPTNGSDDLSIQTLALVDLTKVHETEEAAKADVAADIFVERGVAKVTAEATQTSYSIGNEDTDDLEPIDLNGTLTKVEIKGFLLDRTNTKMYVVRNSSTDDTYDGAAVGDNWWGIKNTLVNNYKNTTFNGTSLSNLPYRMIGNTVVGYWYKNDDPNDTHTANGGDYAMYETKYNLTALYRTYWAKDPNYDGAADYDDLTYYEVDSNDLDDLTFETISTTTSNPLYCLENTFNVDNMNKDESTRIIVKTIFNEGADFYAIGDVGGKYQETTFTNKTSVEDIINEIIKGEYNGDKPIIAAYESVAKVYADNLENMPSIFTIKFTDSKDDSDLTKSTSDAYIKIELNNSLEPQDFDDNDGADPSPSSETLNALKEYVSETSGTVKISEIVEMVNDDIELAYYMGGVCYYPVIIKHFGDDLAYWEQTSTVDTYPSSGNYSDINETAYTNPEVEWLGRWGVLRNNWYDIQINSVKKLGYPTVPPVEGTDDDFNSYLGVKINVLSWAYRSQAVDL